MSLLYKTIRPLSTGISYDVAPHLLAPDKWTTLRQMRVAKGLVENFPGWSSILASGKVGDYGTLVTDFASAFGRQLILGGHNKLYRYDEATRLLVDLAPSLTFNPTLDERWFPFSYGDTLYLVNINDGLVYYTGGGTVTPVLGSPPHGRSGQILNDHVCLFYTRDSDGLHARRFQWSAEGAPSTWTPSLTADAGRFDLNDTPDVGVAFHKLGVGGVAYKTANTYSITYIGGNEVFSSHLELPDIGLLGTFALINLDTEHFAMGNRQFFRYRGGSNVDLEFGREVHNLVYPRLHATLRSRACTLYLKATDELVFFYPTVNSQGENDEAVVYGRRYNAWYGPFTVAVDIAGVATGGTVIHVDDVLDIVDTVSTIVDLYPQGTIGEERPLFIAKGGDVLQIGTTQTANGVAITRVLESGEVELGKDVTTIDGQPINLPAGTVLMATALNLGLPFIQPGGTIQVFVGHRMELSQAPSFAGPYSVPVTGGGTYRVPIRATGRWFSVRIIVPNSMNIKLADLQWAASPVGRR